MTLKGVVTRDPVYTVTFQFSQREYQIFYEMFNCMNETMCEHIEKQGTKTYPADEIYNLGESIWSQLDDFYDGE